MRIERCAREGCENAAFADISVEASVGDRIGVTLYFCSLVCVAAQAGLTTEEIKEMQDAAARLAEAGPRGGDDLPN